MEKMTKSFDCLQFKRQVQEKIREEIEGMTLEEEQEFFRRRAEEGPLGGWWKAVKVQDGGK